MTTPSDLRELVNAAIPRERAVTTADLRKLYALDSDALFRLAIAGVDPGDSIGAKGLVWMARTTSVLMRDGFSIATRAQQHYAMGNRGGILALDGGQEDIQFLQELYSGGAYGSKLESRVRSRECMAFFLELHEWDAAVRRSILLSVDPEDAVAILGGLPRYQYLSLLDSAREVVRHPAAVFKGLRRDGAMKSEGWAFCGIPSRQRLNDGTILDPPSGHTFVVFADPEGYVFDWDWVPASKGDPAVPRDFEARFASPGITDQRGELLVGNLSHSTPLPFLTQRAWFSTRGDCVFVYLSDAEAYAARFDDYLTAFFRLRDGVQECVGFKLKMVSILMQTVRRWSQMPNEGIQVNFDRETVQVSLTFLMNAWLAARLPLSTELLPGMRLMETLGEAGRVLREKPPVLDIPSKALRQLQTV